MEIKVVMNKNVKQEIDTLTHNIEKLNNDNEIMGWLLGDWATKDNDLVLTLDEFIIPNQEVSGAEVEIDESSMINMINELGLEKCSRIKAHWHIHPFAKDKTDWSCIDDAKISDFARADKGRDIFCFLLSSKNEIKARVIINSSFKMANRIIHFKNDYNNINVLSEDDTNAEIYLKLANRIKEKCVKKTYSSIIFKDEDSKQRLDVTEFKVYADKKQEKIVIRLTKEFCDWLITYNETPEEILKYSKLKVKHGIITLQYNVTDLDMAVVADVFEEHLYYLASIYDELQTAKEDVKDLTGYGKGEFWRNDNHHDWC